MTAAEQAPSFYQVDDEHSGEHGQQVLVFGPPGCGKTHFLTGSIKHTAYVRGAENIMVASFTRTAAHELAGRLGPTTPIPKRQLGTLHSLCYSALDRPELTVAHLDDWNAAHPALALSVKPGGATSMDEAGPAEMAAAGATDGDVLMAGYDSVRNQLADPNSWPADVTDYAKRWEAWKAANSLCDFTDLIAVASADCATAPGAPEVGFVDEAQDLTRLEMRTVRRWGERMERLILAGDDDQLLYRFRGATPDAMLGNVADADRLVLSQSWRIPSSVQGAAEAWIRQVSRRQEKLYAPRPEAGLVRHIPAGYNEPMALLRYVEQAMGQEFPDRDTGEMRPASVMVIAPCGYQLDPIKHELRKHGLPFSNPWRPTRGDWNPMKGSTERTTAAKDRLLAYLALEQRNWTGEDLRRWVHVVKTSTAGMVRGAKQTVAGMPDHEIPWEDVAALWVDDDQAARALSPSLDWLAEHLSAAARPGMDFPMRVARKRGAAALVDPPRLYLGTAHSFKGAEADCSPGDEPVLTTNRGWVPISNLDPEVDRLVSFNSDHHKIHRGGPRRPNGYAFTKASRPYDGDLLTITTDSSRTRVTPNHHLTVRWSPRALQAHAVYLMRRDHRWRIGVTKLHRDPNGGSGPVGRARTEGADAVWLLSLHQRREDALSEEKVIAWSSGVPDMTFRADGRSGLTQDALDWTWNRMGSRSADAAKELLASRGLSEHWPLWNMASEKRRRQTGTRNRWTLRAANLMPGWMEIPTDPGHGQEPIWRDVRVAWSRFTGEVYSLDVEKWHHYVSGGAVVHNCVFVIPDLSARGNGEWAQLGESRDSVVRQFYVAMTRARHELVICAASTGMAVPVEKLLAGARPGAA